VPVNNVGLLVYFRLGNKPLLAFVKGLGSLSMVMLAWETPASAPTVNNRGNLFGPWVIGKSVKVLVVSLIPEGLQLGHNGAPC
jgi:hypothetical protein